MITISGDHIEELLRSRARARGWTKEGNGPRWLHPDGGILPLL